MSEHSGLYALIDAYFIGGWRIAPFIKGNTGGYFGVKQWPSRAASSHDELAKLCEEFTEQYRRPPEVFGVVPSEGRYIVDLDCKGGKDGLASWEKHLKELFPLGDAPRPSIIVRSKSGGYHLYYAHTKRIKLPSPTRVLGRDSGVDIRGYTGMVVMPSRIDQHWEPGEYVMIEGRPDSKLSTLPFNQVVPREAVNRAAEAELTAIYEALQNVRFPPIRRFEALPEFIIPESGRDTTLFQAAKLCRRAGLTEAEAVPFMDALALRCEINESENIEHWREVAREKLRRAYTGEHRITSVADFYAELKYAGVVRCAMESGSVYYVRFGSKLLNLPKHRAYTSLAITDLLRGRIISVTEQGKNVYAHKVFGEWMPEVIVDSYGMLPKVDEPFFFNAENQYCVNTYQSPFEGFEPDDGMQRKAREELVPLFKEFVNHVAGGPKEGAYLLQKLAWIVQKPHIKPITANIIWSETRGVGKDSLLDLFGQLFHPLYYIKLEESDFEKNFNVYQERIIAVFSEVQIAPGGYSKRDVMKLVGRVKQLITNRSILVEEKFKPARMINSFTNFFMLSNYRLSAVMEHGERRFDVFHSIEEKVDQQKFGPLLDIANRQNRRDQEDSNTVRYWDNVLWAIREDLMKLEVLDFRKQEAVLSEAKLELMNSFAGDAMDWLRDNLPPYFTKEMVQWLAHMCPYKLDYQWAFDRLREAYGANMKALKHGNAYYRMKGAPVLASKDDGSGRKVLSLEWGYTSVADHRRPVYTLRQEIPTSLDNIPTTMLRAQIERWVKQTTERHYGSVAKLPGAAQSSEQDDVHES